MSVNRKEVIFENVRKWRERLGAVEICAVTKTMPAEDVNLAIEAGIAHIGENRVQELMGKLDKIDKSANIHLIGQLQTNKVKYIVGKVGVIQSLDRLALAQEISKRSEAAGIVTRALVEVSIAREPQKGGIDPDALYPLMEACAALPGLKIEGLMAVMPLTDDPETVRPYFRQMRRLFEELGRAGIPGVSMKTLSMGMSGDCLVAAEEGSTMVRIGRGIFGARA